METNAGLPAHRERPRGRRAAEQRDELAALHVDFVLSLIGSPTSVCHPASLIFTRAVSIILPSATMRSACADASPARTSSTSSSAVNPFATSAPQCSRPGRPRAIRGRGDGRAWGRGGGGGAGAWWGGGGGELGSVGYHGARAHLQPRRVITLTR